MLFVAIPMSLISAVNLSQGLVSSFSGALIDHQLGIFNLVTASCRAALNEGFTRLIVAALSVPQWSLSNKSPSLTKISISSVQQCL